MRPVAKVSVCILTRNRRLQLERCVASIFAQLSASDEVVIADTGSTDGTREWLHELATNGRVKFIFVDGESDFAAARNAVLAAAIGEFILFTDDDCVVAGDWLEIARRKLLVAEAAGGPVLPAILYASPHWWDGAMSWAIGMSPPDVAAGVPHAYPAAANLAARRELLKRDAFPVSRSTFTAKQIYRGGREDADWWRKLRLDGAPLGVDHRMICFHHVPRERISAAYIFSRAYADGQTAWDRQRNAAYAEVAANEFAMGVGRAALAALRVDFPTAGNRALWAVRQLGYVSEASRESRRAASGELVKACAHMAKAGASRFVGRTIESFAIYRRRRFRIPERPQAIVVHAPTYVGDTVLMIPAIDLLARNLPQTRIAVETKYPELLEALPENVSARSIEGHGEPDVRFIPYFHFGDARKYRSSLASRAVTFTADAGFARQSDYGRAARTVEKNFESHETLNLVNLFAQWPLVGDLRRPVLRQSKDAQQSLLQKAPEITNRFATIQIGSGLQMKDWPMERWELLAQQFQRETNLQIVVIGDASQAAAAASLEAKITNCVSLCSKLTIYELVELLAQATIAIGACSAPKHIAIALGTPTFTLYGPSSPARWGALFDRETHGYYVSPAASLSPMELVGLPANYTMLQIQSSVAGEALLNHYVRLSARLGALKNNAKAERKDAKAP